MKFIVEVSRVVQQATSVEVNVLARDVKEAYELTRDENWRDYVEEYVVDELLDEVENAAYNADIEEDMPDWDIEGVEEASSN